MAYRITFVCDALKPGGEQTSLGKTSLHQLLRGLTACNASYLRAHPELPLLSQSGVRLDPTPEHGDWLDIPSTLAQGGVGTWASLACWRAAEQWVRSHQKTYPAFSWSRAPRDLSRITFSLGAFPCRTPSDRRVAHQCIAHCLRALTLIDVAYLNAHPETPALYNAGVHYQEEPPHEEDWADIPTVRRLGWGDCEDLACWRAAELYVRSRTDARPTFLWRARPRGGMLYHIQTRYPDGRVEDPSRRLGMH